MVSKSAALGPLKEALSDLLACCTASETPVVLVGGVAASILGRPRVTRDVDALIWIADNFLPKFMEQAQRHTFVSRTSDALAFAIESRVLLMRHEPTSVDVDIMLGRMPFELEIIERLTLKKFGTLKLPLPSPEDLIVMKALALRPRDISDIEGLLSAFPKLDLARIRHLVVEFAEVVDRPEMVTEIERLIQARP